MFLYICLFSILPRHKHDIANRLVQGALAIAYRRKDVLFQGPLPSNYSINLPNHQISLYFDSFSIKVHDTAQGFEVSSSWSGALPVSHTEETREEEGDTSIL